MLVDKLAAVRHLLICEYPFDHEVKGLTRHFIERIKSELAAETPIIFAHSAIQSKVPMHNPLSQHAIPVRRSLWAGKTKEAIIAAMQEAKFSEEVIAHVLLHKRGLKLTQREIGELLSPPHKSESTYDKNGKEFVDKSALVNVIDAPEA